MAASEAGSDGEIRTRMGFLGPAASETAVYPFHHVAN